MLSQRTSSSPRYVHAPGTPRGGDGDEQGHLVFKPPLHATGTPRGGDGDEQGHLVFKPGCTFDVSLDFPMGRYLGKKLLGSGTYGKVVECVDLKHNAKAAVKVVRRAPLYRAAAEKEIAILRLLNGSAHTPKLLRDFEHAGHICLVFNLHGENLRDVLANR